MSAALPASPDRGPCSSARDRRSCASGPQADEQLLDPVGRVVDLAAKRYAHMPAALLGSTTRRPSRRRSASRHARSQSAHARTCNALSRYASPRSWGSSSSWRARTGSTAERCAATKASIVASRRSQITPAARSARKRRSFGRARLATPSHLPALQPSRAWTTRGGSYAAASRARSHTRSSPRRCWTSSLARSCSRETSTRGGSPGCARRTPLHSSSSIGADVRAARAASRSWSTPRGRARKTQRTGQERGGQPQAARPTPGRPLLQRDPTRAPAGRRRRRRALRRAPPGPPPRHPRPAAGLALCQPQNLSAQANPFLGFNTSGTYE